MHEKKALVYRCSEEGIKPSVETFVDYKGMQSFVDGLIERVDIPLNINGIDYDVYVNEEGLYTQVLPSMVLLFNGEIHNIIKGNFFITKADDEGESVSLTDDEIMDIREYVARNSHFYKYKNEEGTEFLSKLFVANY